MPQRIGQTEPAFMQELHKVRATLSREWQRMSPPQMLASLREATARLRLKRPALQKR